MSWSHTKTIGRISLFAFPLFFISSCLIKPQKAEECDSVAANDSTYKFIQYEDMCLLVPRELKFYYDESSDLIGRKNCQSDSVICYSMILHYFENSTEVDSAGLLNEVSNELRGNYDNVQFLPYKRVVENRKEILFLGFTADTDFGKVGGVWYAIVDRNGKSLMIHSIWPNKSFEEFQVYAKQAERTCYTFVHPVN